ncbi:MAG TPA: UvrB/UvrC motif-containing protein, partial [Candidatus Paceibacterota bacterium]|nr:UvrB/UvrC motif-containing protein [Candidatus Paceibacterota bacterium]
VRSYFDDDLIATRGPRIVDMVTKADRVVHETTPTVLEALVREAALIKKYLPKANVEGKDDKSFLYVVITKEEWPRVLTVRGKDLQGSTLEKSSLQISRVFGPFPSGPQLREALRLIRKIFPFYDTPKPITTKSKHIRSKIEFNRQIGHYPRELDPKAYKKSIRNVVFFLAGRAGELRKRLAREMTRAAKEERFEDAAEARRELFALDHIQDVSLIKQETENSEQKTEDRIEAYDTAHLAGTNAIGVMTVLVGGVPSKKDYRSFNIKGFKKNDDIASLKEILSRRLGHPEWPLPKAFVIDGGTAQKKAAESVLAEAGIAISVMAVVKDERHRPREIIGARRAGVSEADAVLANSEAHRFSLARHRAARSRELRSK